MAPEYVATATQDTTTSADQKLCGTTKCGTATAKLAKRKRKKK